jgi:KDO2-lipid IV(A) lauroyltransferase
MKGKHVIWASILAFRSLCRTLPHRAALPLGASLGRTVWKFSGRRAAKARVRCERALGVNEAEAGKIVLGSYEHFGKCVAEFLRLPLMSGRLCDMVELKGEKHLREAMKGGRGVIFLSAHIGNWEYGAALMASMGFPMNAIGAEQRDPRITDAIADTRRSVGVNHVSKGLELKAAVSCLKRGEVLAVLLDQDARDAGVVSLFLGLPASTPIGPIKLARKFGAPVVPVHVLRKPDGESFLMTIEPPLEGRDGEPFGLDVQYAADRCNETISAWISKTPEQWMWMYPRWESTLGDA